MTVDPGERYWTPALAELPPLFEMTDHDEMTGALDWAAEDERAERRRWVVELSALARVNWGVPVARRFAGPPPEPMHVVGFRGGAVPPGGQSHVVAEHLAVIRRYLDDRAALEDVPRRLLEGWRRR